MRTIRLKNFRSFEDTGTIELRPLVVLVGANNSGKSSFLRFFPLLRQTFEAPPPPASPVLWYGSYVDFGDFSGAVRRGAEPRELTVELAVRHAPAPPPESVSLTLSVSFREVDRKTRTVACSIVGSGVSCALDLLNPDDPGAFVVQAGESLVLRRKIPESWGGGQNAFVPMFLPTTAEPAPGFGDLAREIENISLGSIESEAAEALARFVKYGDPERMMEGLLHVSRAGPALEKRLRSEPSAVERIRALSLAAWFWSILMNARAQLATHAARTIYIGPFRANPARFYRFQELPISHISRDGENLAMLLRALAAEELESFSAFVHEHLGYRVHLHAEGSHVSILLEDDNGTFNLMDMGYGFSQVLPVVAQCWATASGRRAEKRDLLPSMLAIEQPELHLHPFYQAKLADMFVGVVKAVREARKEYPEDIELLVETHSEALVSRLGELVEEGKLASEDVSVLLFEKDPKTGITSIRQSSFAPDGTLTNWPIGFFAP